ncbi:HIG1 domain family member 2A, mitochondrial [Chrysoperla carnea]|uniref:HIG1 domain family member 2A, mitochondrial n=1 Tax=Chrysoperla carnea TaxID=189513 RepID=UPI001D0945B3|nr:HIG1 domain family member 2A, mitochondrial [Chrysoperla carnea]
MDKNEEPEFDWVQIRKDMGNFPLEETTKEKMIRKMKENPFVPIGCLATFSALSYGLWSFRHGRRKTSQLMMRLRVAAQGFTLVALVAGIGLAAAKPQVEANKSK